MKTSFKLYPFGRGFDLHNRRLKEVLKFLSDIGYDGVEAKVDWRKSAERRIWVDIRELFEAYGLKPSCLIGSTTLNSPDSSERKRSVKITKAVIDISNLLECENVLIAGAKLPSKVSIKRAWNWSVKTIREVANHALHKGVRLVYEYWNRFETNFINNTDDVIKLIEQVNSDGLYAMLDTFHMNIEEKSFVEPVRKLGKMLKYVHLSENNRLPLGRGHIDFLSFLKALKEIGYDGYLCVEIFYYRDRDWPKRPYYAAREYARESIQFLKNIGIEL